MNLIESKINYKRLREHLISDFKDKCIDTTLITKMRDKEILELGVKIYGQKEILYRYTNFSFVFNPKNENDFSLISELTGKTKKYINSLNKKKEIKIIYLNVTSFIGVSIGAEHFYGKLIYSGKIPNKDGLVFFFNNFHKKEHEIKRIIDEKESDILSKKDGFIWRTGYETCRFNDKFDLISVAEETAKELANKQNSQIILVTLQDGQMVKNFSKISVIYPDE